MSSLDKGHFFSTTLQFFRLGQRYIWVFRVNHHELASGMNLEDLRMDGTRLSAGEIGYRLNSTELRSGGHIVSSLDLGWLGTLYNLQLGLYPRNYPSTRDLLGLKLWSVSTER